MTEWEAFQNKKLITGIQTGVVLLTPCISYLCFEFITGNLTDIRGAYLALNLILFALLYWTLAAIINSVRIAYTIWNVSLLILAMAEYFVVSFRARPILIWDALALRTAMSVSGNYTYEPTAAMFVAVAVMTVLTILAWRWPVKLRTRVYRLAAAGAAVVCFIGFMGLFYLKLVPALNIEISMWNPDESLSETGYVLGTLRSIEYLRVKKPEGYSKTALAEIEQETENARASQNLRWAADTDVVPTNIICIMNESFSDLQVIGEFETDVPYLSYYHSLEENCIKGNLYVPVFGSMTCNSEYEFLTGNSMAFAPEGSVPFQVYMNNPVYGLARTVKAQGYRTIGMHPYPAANWNRDEAYRELGFDEFLAGDYFEDSPLIRKYVSDKGNYDKIIELTEQKEDGQPLFVFNVTMQNHGGYEDDYEASVHLTDYPDMPMTEQYLSLIKESDEALQYLLEYYSQVEEPTMIVMFGDHQPSVEEEFYEALYGGPLDELSPENYLRRYITPFLVWTNYETPSESVDKLSAQYLSNMVLERANLEMTDYNYFLEQMREMAPVVHMMGYYNSDGVWESWTNWKNKKEYPMFRKFDYLQYNHMFDKKTLLSFFAIGEE